MASLAAIFGNSAEKSQDSEKLLHLYWNRAELKKEFANMRKERYRLQDKIKQQEGAAARLQQKLDHLESLLLDPQWAANVVVFYQLRGLALRCQRKLAKFAEQLKQQREQRQHNELLAKWNDERSRQTKAIEQKRTELRNKCRLLEDEMEAEKNRLMAMSGFLKFFRRRSVAAILDRLSREIEDARQSDQDLVNDLGEIRNRKAPENQGLDLQSKRSINFLILSFAQQLFLCFADDDLAMLAKEAGEKSVGSVKYGNRHDCAEFLQRIQKRNESMDEGSDVAGLLQQRARLIGEKAQFRDDRDAVPVAGTVSTVFDMQDDGVVRKSEANLLGENYWGIAKVLSR